MQAQSDEGAERVTAMDGSGGGCDMRVIRFSILIVEKNADISYKYQINHK